MKQVSCGDKIVELGSSADRQQQCRANDTTPRGLVTPSECRDMSPMSSICLLLFGAAVSPRSEAVIMFCYDSE